MTEKPEKFAFGLSDAVSLVGQLGLLRTPLCCKCCGVFLFNEAPQASRLLQRAKQTVCRLHTGCAQQLFW